MRPIGVFIAVFVPIVVSFLLLLLSAKEWKVAQEKARARRIADAKMNARLLSFDL